MSSRFRDRVAQLRAAWRERRELERFAGSTEAEQRALLRELHRWASEAADDIAAAYGGELRVTVTPEAPSDDLSAFTVTIADGFRLTLSLSERGRSRWTISAAVTPGPGAPAVAAGPNRRSSRWTRDRLEELLLSLLTAYERTRTRARSTG